MGRLVDIFLKDAPNKMAKLTTIRWLGGRLPSPRRGRGPPCACWRVAFEATDGSRDDTKNSFYKILQNIMMLGFRDVNQATVEIRLKYISNTISHIT
jgi:hypothetical protein